MKRAFGLQVAACFFELDIRRDHIFDRKPLLDLLNGRVHIFYSSALPFFLKPVPAGIKRPMMTFSLRPRRLSTPPLMAFSMSTRLVFWKDAADSQLLVRSDTSVMPRATDSALASLAPSFATRLFSSMKAVFSTMSPMEKLVSPAPLIFLRENIWRTIISVCFLAMEALCSS